MGASKGLSVSLVPSDRGGAHLEGASHLSAGEYEVGRMEAKEDKTIQLEECNVDSLLLDDLREMYSAVEDIRERVTINEGDISERGRYTTEWTKRSGMCIMNLNLVYRALGNHGAMGLMMLYLHRSFIECIRQWSMASAF